MRSRKTALAVTVAALVLSACGARLTPQQRAAGIGALARGGGTAGGETSTGGTEGQQGTEGTQPSAGASGSTGTQGGNGGAPAPPGGNGGATDTGVTGDAITIGVVSDISGPTPGLFKSTHQAVQALAAYVNSQGGIYGRALKPLLLDSKTDSTQNRAATQDACGKSFALVGSMSAFDDGGADIVHNCGKGGIPDITAITTTPERAHEPNTLAAYPNRSDKIIVGPAKYLLKTHKEATQGAAQLWLNAAVARVNAQSRMKAYTKVGFKYVYTASIQLVEANYDSYVQAMKNHNPPVKYVDMVSDYQSIVRLLKAMKDQNWYPEVLDWDSVVYSQGFLDLLKEDGRNAGDKSMFFINTAMFEETNSNPELQLYTQWLQRVAPGARPDYFGLYAWSAARLFAEKAKEVGPKLTRAALFSALRKEHAWGANGLHAAHDIGNKTTSDCFLYGVVKNNKFQRLYPGSKWNCNGGLVSP